MIAVAASPASAITATATTTGVTLEEMFENLTVYVVAEKGATLSLAGRPAVVGKHAVYVVMITESDARSGGDTYEEQPLLVPLPKDSVQVKDNALTITRPISTIGYCLSPGSAVPGWNGKERLVIPTWKKLSSKFAIAVRPDKIKDVLKTGIAEPEWVRYVRITGIPSSVLLGSWIPTSSGSGASRGTLRSRSGAHCGPLSRNHR
ncbi:hypothetical protein [Methanopyrus sp.]